jgi:pyruvate dehydrogenase kinase 2/3/4
MPSVRKVRSWYAQSFQELFNFPPIKTVEDEVRFTQLLQQIYDRHAPTLLTMAKGVYELKKELSKEAAPDSVDLSEYAEIHQGLDDFYMSRIGLRMLIGQHIELHRQMEKKELNSNYIGLINKVTSVASVARDSIEDAKYMVMKSHSRCPYTKLYGKVNVTFPYVPSHLYYMLFELLKNSMRAVVEYHANKKELPEIRVIVAASDETNSEDIAIKISDEGGGFNRSAVRKIWSYMYTTAPFNFDEHFESENVPDFGRDAPLAGLGYGLPLSRLYARYFGGDLQLISMGGYGTDAYLHLHRLGDREEPLPL